MTLPRFEVVARRRPVDLVAASQATWDADVAGLGDAWLSLRAVAPYVGVVLPWPTLVRDHDGWLLVTFDGTRAGGGLLGCGTHGDVVLMRAPDQAAAGRP